jgi:hypothetical protein
MAGFDPGNLSYNPYGSSSSGSGGGGGGGVSAGSGAAAIKFLRGLLPKKGGDQSLTSGTGLDQSGGSSPSLDDQILALKMQALDAKYGAAGSGGGGGGPSLAAYKGPSIESLRQYGATGATDINQSYADLHNYLQNSGNASQLYLADAKNKEAAGYAKAGSDIALGKTAPGANVIAGSDVGDAAAKESNAAIQKIYQHYADLNAQHSTVAQQALDTLATGRGDISTELLAGKGRQGNEQLYRFNSGVNQKIVGAQQQIDAINAENSRRIANYNASQSSKAAAAEGNKEAAKLNLLAGYLKSTQGGHLSGVQGVLKYALQQGSPEAGQKFLQMIAGARNATNTQNQAALSDKSGLTKKTTTQEQLFKMMGSTVPDVNDTQTMMDLINTQPGLRQLQKYVLQSPQQVTSNLDLWEQMNPGIKSALAKQIQGGSKLGMNQNQILGRARDAYSKQFQPTINMSGLRANPSDMRTLNDYLSQQQNNADLYQSLFEIYSGKYGTG